MNNLKIVSFRENLKTFIKNYDLPSEVKRMVIAEIYAETERSALEDTLKEAEEREKNEKD